MLRKVTEREYKGYLRYLSECEQQKKNLERKMELPQYAKEIDFLTRELMNVEDKIEFAKEYIQAYKDGTSIDFPRDDYKILEESNDSEHMDKTTNEIKGFTEIPSNAEQCIMLQVHSLEALIHTSNLNKLDSTTRSRFEDLHRYLKDLIALQEDSSKSKSNRSESSY